MNTGMNKNDLAAFGICCIGIVVISLFALECGYIPMIERNDSGRISLSFSKEPTTLIGSNEIE